MTTKATSLFSVVNTHLLWFF